MISLAALNSHDFGGSIASLAALNSHDFRERRSREGEGCKLEVISLAALNSHDFGERRSRQRLGERSSGERGAGRDWSEVSC